MGYLPSVVQMQFIPECSNQVKRSLEFITEKIAAVGHLWHQALRAALCNCWSTQPPLFSQVSQLQRLLPLPEGKRSPPCKAAQQLHDRKDFALCVSF